MPNFKKSLNLRIILTILVSGVLFTSIGYPADNLRVPMRGGDWQKAGRLKTSASIQISSFDLRWFKEAADLFGRRIPASGTSLFTWQYYSMPGAIHLMATDMDNQRLYGVITGKPDSYGSSVLKIWGIVIDESLEATRKEHIGLRLILAFVFEAEERDYRVVETEVMPSLIRLARQYGAEITTIASSSSLHQLHRIPVRVDLEANRHLFKAIRKGDVSLEEVPFSSLRAKLLYINNLMGLQQIKNSQQKDQSL